MFALGLTFDFFADQKKEAMATDGGKASGGEGGTKGKSSGSQVSVKFDLKGVAQSAHLFLH